MHARVARLRIRPEAVEQAIHCFEERIIPVAREQRGFFGALLLVDREDASAYSISLWASASDIESSIADGRSSAQLDAFGDLLAGRPLVEVMEVCVQD